jgi:hypothetical protein
MATHSTPTPQDTNAATPAPIHGDLTPVMNRIARNIHVLELVKDELFTRSQDDIAHILNLVIDGLGYSFDILNDIDFCNFLAACGQTEEEFIRTAGLMEGQR